MTGGDAWGITLAITKSAMPMTDFRTLHFSSITLITVVILHLFVWWFDLCLRNTQQVLERLRAHLSLITIVVLVPKTVTGHERHSDERAFLC